MKYTKNNVQSIRCLKMTEQQNDIQTNKERQYNYKLAVSCIAHCFFFF